MTNTTETSVRLEQIVSVCLLVSEHVPDIERTIASVSCLARLHARYVEILVIDNHTDAETRTALHQLQQRLPDIRCIRLSRAYSQEHVLAAALDHSIGDAVVVLRAGLDAPDLASVVLKQLASGIHVVMGQGTAPNRAWKGLRLFADRSITEDSTAFCHGLSRQALNSLTRIRSKSRKIALEARRLGFPTLTLVTAAGGGPAPGFLERVQVLVAYSLRPLRFAALLGITASFLNLAYLVYILAVAFIKQRIAEGWLTTSLTHTIMSFLQFLILAILAEYVGRILEETKDQPLYFIEGETLSVVSTISPDRLNVAGEVAS